MSKMSQIEVLKQHVSENQTVVKNRSSTLAVVDEKLAVVNATANPRVTAEIRVPTQPIQIKVDSPTDYFAAVLTPLVVAVAAAVIAWLNQKNAIRSTEALQRLQLRSATANFRQTWSTDFRTFSAEYVSSVTQLFFKKLDDPNFLDSPAANELHALKTTARASIRMMLDTNKPYTSEITAIMDDVDDALFDAHPTQPRSPMPHLTKFVDKAQEVRELAWTDIKKDLHHQ
jgi:hypothetical protein